MRRSRKEPPPRTPEEREAARAERERQRAARSGGTATPAARPPRDRVRVEPGEELRRDFEVEPGAQPRSGDTVEPGDAWSGSDVEPTQAPRGGSDDPGAALRRGFEPGYQPDLGAEAEIELPIAVDAPTAPSR